MSLSVVRYEGKSTPAPDCFEINRLIRRSGLSYAAQALLGAILDHDRYGQSSKGCTASLATLAAEIDATPRYVTKLIGELLAGDWIEADPQKGNTRALRMGPACTPVLRTVVPPRVEQPFRAPRNDRSITYEQSFGQRESEERRERDSGFSPPSEEKTPETAAEILALMKSVGERFRAHRDDGGERMDAATHPLAGHERQARLEAMRRL
ncbi:MAG: hypothetical protein ACXWN0_10575 [Isosphaeraceae bacterium]